MFVEKAKVGLVNKKDMYLIDNFDDYGSKQSSWNNVRQFNSKARETGKNKKQKFITKVNFNKNVVSEISGSSFDFLMLFNENEIIQIISPVKKIVSYWKTQQKNLVWLVSMAMVCDQIRTQNHVKHLRQSFCEDNKAVKYFCKKLHLGNGSPGF